MSRYTLGIDYGTLSARALLVDVESGREVATAVYEYPSAVISGEYHGKKLGRDFALQEVRDYIRALEVTIPAVTADINPDELVGIGIDFTSSTILPLDEKGVPLALDERFADEPHAAVKLWKHHGAKEQADRLADVLERLDPERLKLYGGKVSSEWMLPKIMETLDNAPELYFAADRFVEAGDYICTLLTGVESHSLCAAGYKALYTPEGYPSNEVMLALDERLDGIIGTKISTELTEPGRGVGCVCAEAAKRFGLAEGIPVASAYIDAHAALPACKVTESGKLLMIIGTSTGHIILSDDGNDVTGICGVVKDGIIPGKYAYEAGQAAVGDIFDWFVKSCVPEAYVSEAREREVSLHKLLREKVRDKAPGEIGLLALDWWNGNRSPLQDASLSGLLVGLTLETKPEEIYRALLESTAFGTRKIIDNFEAGGVAIDELIAAGGIAAKDDFMMQIYADVTGRPIKIAASAQSPALGSAIAASVAAGVYPDFTSAADRMGGLREGGFVPNPEAKRLYDKLYELWCELCDYFGSNGIMKRLREVK